MLTLPLAVGIFMNLLLILWIIISLLLILIVLIQKAKGGGLSSAFGGMGASSLLGTKTGDVLTWVTISLAVIFLGLGAFLVKFYRPSAPTGLQNPPATVPASSAPGTDNAAAPTTAETPAAPASNGTGTAAPAAPTDSAATEVQPAPAETTPTTPVTPPGN